MNSPLGLQIAGNASPETAGHGSGKPTDMIIEEYADMWAFLADNLDLELPEGYGN